MDIDKDIVVWVGRTNRRLAVVTRNVVHCEDFGEFVRYFINAPVYGKLPKTVSISLEDVFENGTMTPVEYVNCYTNFIKLTGQQLRMSTDTVTVSVRVGQTLITRNQVEQLQQTNIIGINPRQVVYGAEAVLESIYERNRLHASWPGYLINSANTTASNSIVLTDRQQVICDLISYRGLSNKQIARYMNISESTVKFHVGHLLKKYHLRNRTQLAVLRKAV